jgi:hypothetical protein
MTKLMTQQAILELRELLEREIDPLTIKTMTDEDISYIGFFLLEVFVQGLNTRK